MGRVLGFHYDEIRALGHWLRDKNEAAEAANAIPNGKGSGRSGGALNERGTMQIRYTQGDGRKGERFQQLAIRSKLVAKVRAGLRKFNRHWTSLPSGVRDWVIIDPAVDTLSIQLC